MHRLLGRSLQQALGPMHPPVEHRWEAGPKEVEGQLGGRVGLASAGGKFSKFKIWLLRRGMSMQDYLEAHIAELVKDERL